MTAVLPLQQRRRQQLQWWQGASQREPASKHAWPAAPNKRTLAAGATTQLHAAGSGAHLRS